MTVPHTPDQEHKQLSFLQWVAIAVVVALAVVVCITLGRWQFSRYEARTYAISTVEANYTSTPQDISEVLPESTTVLPSSKAWTQVELSGQYQPQFTSLLRNRPVNSTPGVHVLVPFVTEDGHTLLVNRGWVAQDTDFNRPSVLPEPPQGQATITVHLRESEPRSDKDAPVGQVQMIHVPDAISAGLEYGKGTEQSLPGVYVNAYGSLVAETPVALDSINPPPKPSTDPKNHLSYAMQWWVFAIGAVAGFGVLIVRENRMRKGAIVPSNNPFSQLAAEERAARTTTTGRDNRRKSPGQSEEEYEDSLFE